jgi:hypothetical protein
MTREDIKALAVSLNIDHLVHFTQATNLPTIIKHGLYPVGRAGEIGITPQINDHLRLDGHTDSTSLSINFPNDKMFYKYRMADPTIGWAVLVLPRKILWEKDCAFCNDNAASTSISSQSLDALKTVEAFENIFKEDAILNLREEQRLKPHDPTNVQAEVLAFDVIEPRYIKFIAFDSDATMNAYKHLLVGNCRPWPKAGRMTFFSTRKQYRAFGN